VLLLLFYLQSPSTQLEARRAGLVCCSQHVKSHTRQPQPIHAGWINSWQHAAAAGPQISRSSTTCAAASVAGLQAAGDDSFLHPYGNQPLQQQLHQGQQLSAGASSRKLLSCVRTSQSYSQLLNLLQDCSTDEISTDLLRAVLFRAAKLARSTAAPASKAGSKSSTSSSSGSSRDALAAQQLVCACLQLLLDVNEQISGWHLSNCLLSLGVLCGRGGPASPVMAGAGAGAVAADHAFAASAVHSTLQQQQQGQRQQQGQQQQQVSGVLQQLLLNPARSSRRDLEALLQATGPQHQLQQLLHLTRKTAVASAQPQHTVDMLYGLAVLRVRPAPHVLGLMLHGLQEQLQDMQETQLQAGSPSAGDVAAGGHDGSSSSRIRMHSAGPGAAAGAAAAAGVWTPKLLSQLLWCAATLQLHLPQPWLESYWAASLTALPLYGAQVRLDGACAPQVGDLGRGGCSGAGWGGGGWGGGGRLALGLLRMNVPDSTATVWSQVGWGKVHLLTK
jgi:hypothetical protein